MKHPGKFKILLSVLGFVLCSLWCSAQNPGNSPDTITVKIQDDTIIAIAPHRAGSEQTTPQVIVRNVPDSIVDTYKKDPEFSYANDPSFWKKQPPPSDTTLVKLIDWLSRSTLVRWLLYLFLAAVVIFALYQIMVVNDFFVFSRTRKKTIDPEMVEDELHGRNIDELLQNAIAEKNYRLATRLFYLKTLQFLSERQLLQLNAKATNQDYMRQFRQNARSVEFNKLTSIYEFVWYGEYPVTEGQFELVQQQFKRFISGQ